jgi:hypothetical protein
VFSFCFKPSAKKALTAVRAHERASTRPRLHRAKPVAWVWLRWGTWVMMVKRQGSNVSWQNMAFLLVVADGEISRSMPQGGESNQPAQKPTPESPASPQLATLARNCVRFAHKTSLSWRRSPPPKPPGRYLKHLGKGRFDIEIRHGRDYHPARGTGRGPDDRAPWEGPYRKAWPFSCKQGLMRGTAAQQRYEQAKRPRR